MSASQTNRTYHYAAELFDLLLRKGADPKLHFLDQIKVLSKEELFRLSYDSIATDLPDHADGFLSVLSEGEPTTISGRALHKFVSELGSALKTMPAFDFAEVFVRKYLARALGKNTFLEIKNALLDDLFFERAPEVCNGLEMIQMLWTLDPMNDNSPDKASPLLYRKMDRVSIYAYWSRKVTNPIHIDAGPGKGPLGTGYVYDLRSMANYEPPLDDISPLIKSTLAEADLLRSGSIPTRAFVEINFPPFVMLVFEEINPAFVMVEALDSGDRVLPIYLFPTQRRWRVPNTGCGPDGKMTSFKSVVTVLVAMASAALRDFWVIEERERLLGPPQIVHVKGSRRAGRRVVYLPRIRYVGGQNLGDKADRATNMTARAAHWRSEHYRKLPPGQKPTLRQVALAAAFKRAPPEGYTWVRGASVAGVEAERVYRSRSLSQVLFDVVPSKSQVFTGLNWFQFEVYCSRWLKSNGFDEVARTAIDNGIDITAFSKTTPPEQWVVQCKHWKLKVGPEIVRELEGARILRKADRAMLITSSAFSSKSIDTAMQLNIGLVDGDRLKGV